MITTLNQLTNVRLLVPYHAKVTGAGSDIVAIGTSARAFSAVDNSKKDLLPNPEEMH